MEDVTAIVEAELIKGNGKSINPTQIATRAEVATLLYKICKK